MIKANELSVGNWVEYEGKPVMVSAVHLKKIGIHESPNRLKWIRLGLISPIPLTIELIKDICTEKAKLTGHAYVIGETIGIAPTRGEYLVYDTESVSYVYVKHVHELQNTLTLMKNPINIKL